MKESVFFLIDRIKGGLIKKNLNELYLLKNNYKMAIEKRDSRASVLLNDVCNHVPFYKKLGLSPNAVLKQFPVIDKNSIRLSYSEFHSDKYKNVKSLKKVSTSGSTGTPFHVYHSFQKISRNYADNLFFGQFVKYKIGIRVYYMRIWNDINKQGFLKKAINNTVPLNVADMSDDSFEHIHTKLQKAPKNAIILGYGSALTAYADFLKRNNLNAVNRIAGIWVMAEPLNNHARLYLKQFYSCSVYARYSNSENGFIAHQYSNDSDAYLINNASYIVELLKFENNDPVAIGEKGRVVVTDLYNDAFPMIRYDTGDIAVGGQELFNGNKVDVLKSIEGRKLDFIYDSNGQLISPHTIDYALRRLPNLLQFQFVQEGKNDYKLLINSFNFSNELEQMAIMALKEYLGDDAKVLVIPVNEIPLLNSGKRKLVVNMMN